MHRADDQLFDSLSLFLSLFLVLPLVFTLSFFLSLSDLRVGFRYVLCVRYELCVVRCVALLCWIVGGVLRRRFLMAGGLMI